jgi:hypothetical protein
MTRTTVGLARNTANATYDTCQQQTPHTRRTTLPQEIRRYFAQRRLDYECHSQSNAFKLLYAQQHITPRTVPVETYLHRITQPLQLPHTLRLNASLNVIPAGGGEGRRLCGRGGERIAHATSAHTLDSWIDAVSQ